MRRRSALWLALLSAATGVPIGMGIAGNATPPAPPEAPARSAVAWGPQGSLGEAQRVPGVPGSPHVGVQGLHVVAEPGTRLLDWDVLRSFEYAPALGLGALPAEIRVHDGTRVTMVGYLVPTYAYDDIREFCLVGSPWSCHFGDVAGLSGSVQVVLRPGHVGLDATLEPLRVVGTFRAREVRESGWLLAIYTLDDALAVPVR